MSPGFVAFGGRTNWVDEIGINDAAWYKGEALVAFLDMTSTVHLQAWRCQKCALIVMDYGAGLLYSPFPWEKDKSPVVVQKPVH